MLPLPPRLARKKICGPWGEIEACPLETGSAAATKAKHGSGAERDSNDVLEYVAIAVPADSGARIVTSEQDMDEVVRLQSCECRRLRPNAVEPGRDRLGASEARIVEVVPPAEAHRLAMAEPAVEAKRREIERHQSIDQLAFFGLPDHFLAIF